MFAGHLEVLLRRDWLRGSDQHAAGSLPPVPSRECVAGSGTALATASALPGADDLFQVCPKILVRVAVLREHELRSPRRSLGWLFKAITKFREDWDETTFATRMVFCLWARHGKLSLQMEPLGIHEGNRTY